MKKILLLFFLTLISGVNATYALDLSEWIKYADGLQNCTPGTYHLPEDTLMAISEKIGAISYQITGMKAGKCQIRISRTIKKPNQKLPTTQIIDCALSPENLAVLSQTAIAYATGMTSLSPDDSASTILQQACRITS